MKKIFAILMFAALLAACTREEKPQTEKFCTLTVEASKGGPMTRALILDDSGAKNVLNAEWKIGEEVTVYLLVDMGGGVINPISIGVLEAKSDGPSTTLGGTIQTAGIDIPGSSPRDLAPGDELTLKLEGGSAPQDGTLKTLADNFDKAEATITISSISGSTVTTSAADFVNESAIFRFSLKDKAGNAINPESVVINTTTSGVSPVSSNTDISVDASTYAANGDGVIFASLPFTTSFSGSILISAEVGGDQYEYYKTEVSFAAGKYYEINVKMAKLWPFTINAGGDKVLFSPGNLQWSGNNGWRFALHQYDYIGKGANNSSPSASNDNYMDLFCWGATGLSSGEGTAPIPNSSTKEYCNSLYDLSGIYEWGNVKITNTGNTGWRTPSRSDWTYLFNSASKYGFATVAGNPGMILLPDGFVDPNTNGGSNAFSGGNIMSTYTLGGDWEAMEAAGAVFLPCCDYDYPGEDASYWSSTSNVTNTNSYFLYFSTYSMGIDYNSTQNRANRFAVRLVRDY